MVTRGCNSAKVAGRGTSLTAMDETVADGGTGPGPATTPGEGLAGSQWPAKVAQGVEDTVAIVHDRIVRPILIGARAVVFGLVAAAMALVVLLLLAIAAVRVLDVYAFGHRVWPADLLVGAIFVAIGAFAWSKRTASNAEEA
jgi:hypothetical protein